MQKLYLVLYIHTFVLIYRKTSEKSREYWFPHLRPRVHPNVINWCDDFQNTDARCCCKRKDLCTCNAPSFFLQTFMSEKCNYNSHLHDEWFVSICLQDDKIIGPPNKRLGYVNRK